MREDLNNKRPGPRTEAQGILLFFHGEPNRSPNITVDWNNQTRQLLDDVGVRALCSGFEQSMLELYTSGQLFDVARQEFDRRLLNAVVDGFIVSVERISDRMAAQAVHVLDVDGHQFAFSGNGVGTSKLETRWAGDFEDDAIRLAHWVAEANLLELYSGGALRRNDEFVPELVSALRRTLASIPRLVARLDEEPIEISREGAQR